MDVREPADKPTVYAAPTNENSGTKAMDALARLAGLEAGWMTGRWGPKPTIVGHGTNNRGTAAFRVPYREDANGHGAIESMQVQRRGPRLDRRHNHSNCAVRAGKYRWTEYEKNGSVECRQDV